MNRETHFINLFAAISGLMILISCGEKKTTPSCCCTLPFKAEGSKFTYYAFAELDSAVVCAKKRNLNILVIFSGYAGMAIPNKEWETLDLYGDKKFIQNNYVIAWLPVDDKKPLDDTTQTVLIHGQTYYITTEGRKYAMIQRKLFNHNSQPLYGILNQNLEPVGKAIGYTKDKREVEAFIESGLIRKQ
ncbi:MAG: hypothetical protein MUC87_17130 [Bacteroidia bacterium]|jgi:hypothetical protein|nr:hypothetical protein [Bacteroidia bacterium]